MVLSSSSGVRGIGDSSYRPPPKPAAPAIPQLPAPPKLLPAPVYTVSKPTPPPVTNTAQTNPELTGLIQTYKQALADMKTSIGQQDPLLQENVQNLRNRMSADTSQRAINKSTSSIMDQATAARDASNRAAAQAGADVSGGAGIGISEAGRRRSAGAAADIALGRERDLDALTLGGQAIMAAPGNQTLAKQGMYNSLVGGASGTFAKPAELALQDRNLALNQWQAGNQNQLQQRDQDLRAWESQNNAAMQQWQAYMNVLNGFL